MREAFVLLRESYALLARSQAIALHAALKLYIHAAHLRALVACVVSERRQALIERPAQRNSSRASAWSMRWRIASDRIGKARKNASRLSAGLRSRTFADQKVARALSP